VLHGSVPIKHGAKTKFKPAAIVVAMFAALLGVLGFAKPALAYSSIPAQIETRADFFGTITKPDVDFVVNYEYQKDAANVADPSMTSWSNTFNSLTDMPSSEYYHSDTVVFTAPGTYRFKATMQIPEGADSEGKYNNVRYDKTEYTIEVKIDGTQNDDGSWDMSSPEIYYYKNGSKFGGIVSFNPTYFYTTTTVDIPIEKLVEGRDWKDGESFTFNIEQTGNSWGLNNSDTFTNTSVTLTKDNQTGVFSGISTVMQNGTSEYTITEVDDGSSEDLIYSDPVLIKVTWSVVNNKQEAKLSVSYDQGNSWMDWDESDGPVPIYNYYNAPAEQTIEIPFIKQLDGRDWKDDDQFTFKLTEVEKPGNNSSIVIQLLPNNGQPANSSSTSTASKAPRKAQAVTADTSSTEESTTKYETITADTTDHKGSFSVTLATGEEVCYKITELETAGIENMTYADPVYVVVRWDYDDYGNATPKVYYTTNSSPWDATDDELSTTIPTFVNTYTEPDETPVVPDAPLPGGDEEIVDPTDPSGETDRSAGDETPTVDDKKVVTDSSKTDTTNKTPVTSGSKTAKTAKKAATTKANATPKTADATIVEGIVAIATTGSVLLGTGLTLGKKRK
jgi:hypothetical protein